MGLSAGTSADTGVAVTPCPSYYYLTRESVDLPRSWWLLDEWPVRTLSDPFFPVITGNMSHHIFTANLVKRIKQLFGDSH